MRGTAPDDSESQPYAKVLALLKYRGLDTDQWLDAHRRNMESLLAARATMLKGVEDVSASHARATRAMLDRVMTELPEMLQTGRYEDVARLQTEMAAKMLDAAMVNLRSLTAVITRSNLDVLQVLGGVIDQTFKALNQKP